MFSSVSVYISLTSRVHQPVGISEKGSLQSVRSPCYLNRMDASETVMGWGKTLLEGIRYMINTYSPFKQGYPLEIINCIAPPANEYTFPHDLYN